MWDDALAEAVRNRANKNAAENGDGAKYSLRSYSEQQLRNWENSKRIAVYSSEAQLREFIKDARAGRIGGRKMYFGMVPQNLAQKIMSETGINVDGYNCSLSAYEIQKIFKDHGNAATERLRGQRAVTEDDVAAIPEILQDADTIVLSDKKYNGKPAIQFTKNGNGRVNLVAVVSDKHLDLFVQTMYAGIKKGNLATPTGEQAPINTPEASRSTVSNNNIRSSSENSNTKIKKSERGIAQERGRRRTEIYAELQKLKAERDDLLRQDADYTAAQEKRRYATTFRERVDATRALNAAKAKIDTAELDERIRALQDERSAIDDIPRKERIVNNASPLNCRFLCMFIVRMMKRPPSISAQWALLYRYPL